jgi:hypothetical protein
MDLTKEQFQYWCHEKKMKLTGIQGSLKEPRSQLEQGCSVSELSCRLPVAGFFGVNWRLIIGSAEVLNQFVVLSCTCSEKNN